MKAKITLDINEITHIIRQHIFSKADVEKIAGLQFSFDEDRYGLTEVVGVEVVVELKERV
jgi:hypothetical protein